MSFGRTTTAASLLYFFCLAAIASPLHPFADEFRQAPNPRITITRYSGHPDFHSQQSLAWRLRNGRFFSDDRLSARVQIGDCETLLMQQQRFALDKYVASGLATTEEVARYVRIEHDTSQVNFLQMSRDMPMARAREMFPNEAHRRVNQLIHNVEDFGGVQPIVTATLMVVAGQSLNLATGLVDRRLLPWEKDSGRAELSRNFDRSRYKLVWEWGRAAQDLPSETAPLFAAAAMINYQELLAMGGNMEDAYVMFHSDQRARTRGYSMRFPGTIFPENWDNPNDALFLIPLAQILAAFPPSGHSGKIAELISLSGGALDDLQAMEFLNEFYRIRFTQLDYSPDSSRVGRKPLAIHDLSRIASHRMSALANDFGLNQSPRANDAADFLLRLRESLPSWNSGQYGDLADLAVTGQYYLDNNAVEISNLDERLAATDPDYLKRVLFGVLYYYLKVFSPGAYDFTHVQNTLAFLRQIDVKFGFTTFDPNLAAQIQRLNPSAQTQFYYPPYTDGEVPEFPGQEWLSRGYRTPPNAFLFNMEQIIDLARANPEIFRQSTNLFLHNRWARHLMLTNPDIF